MSIYIDCEECGEPLGKGSQKPILCDACWVTRNYEKHIIPNRLAELAKGKGSHIFSAKEMKVLGLLMKVPLKESVMKTTVTGILGERNARDFFKALSFKLK